MKKSLIAIAISMLGVSGAFACEGQYCTQVNNTNTGKGGVVAGATGSNFVVSGSAAAAKTSGNGTSLSYSANSTAASSEVGVTGTALSNVAKNCDSLISGSVGVFGNVATSSESVAFNTSTGSGRGFAAAGGIAHAEVAAAGKFSVTDQHGMVGGFVAGSAESTTAGGVIAGTNQSGATIGGSVAGFEVSADASLATQGSDKYSLTKNGHHGCTTVTGCGPATADQKTANTSALAYAASGKDTVLTGGAQGGTLTNASATGIAVSGATGGVSDALLSNVKLGNTVPVNN